MHILPGVLSRVVFSCSIILCFYFAATASGGHDPLAFAQGVWQGEANNGREKFKVSVTLKKVNKAILGACDAVSQRGTRWNANFEAHSAGAGRNVTIKVRNTKIKSLEFDIFALPQSGTELGISSLMGDGSIKFLNDFIKAEFEFRSAVTSVKATMYRTYPPAQDKASGGKKGAGKKAPFLPPIIIAPK